MNSTTLLGHSLSGLTRGAPKADDSPMSKAAIGEEGESAEDEGKSGHAEPLDGESSLSCFNIFHLRIV